MNLLASLVILIDLKWGNPNFEEISFTTTSSARKMAIVLSIFITKLNRNRVVASSAIPEDTSSSSLSLSHHPNIIKMNPNKLPKTDYKKRQQQQPSILEIERAIGAGVFRDRDVNSGAGAGGEQTNGLFDNILKNSVGKNEGSVEKRLRETGEWLIHQTDTTSRSAGKQILKFIFVWMIPLWATAFLVATGIVRLPFPTPFLEDLIS